jgi:hypothetical protein
MSKFCFVFNTATGTAEMMYQLGCRLDKCGTGVQFLASARDISLLHSIQTNLLQNGY